jgi:hypothetical protein
MWKWLLFLNGLMLSTMMPPLAAMEPARHLRITRPKDRTGRPPAGPTWWATVWMSNGAGLLDNLDTEEFEVLEDVHVEVAPVS